MTTFESTAKIELSSSRVMHDEAISISIVGLDSWSRIELSLTTEIDGTEFVSSATFYSDIEGNLNIDSQAPVSGSYQGVDGMGLFWSMIAKTPEISSPLSSSRDPWALQPPQQYHLCLFIEGKKIATENIVRVVVAEGIKVIRLSKGKLRGVLFLPSGEGPHPAVLAVSGSGGGYPTEGAVALAGRGFAVLALAYFNADDLPERLVDIPLEYFEEGLEWMKSIAEIDNDRIGVIGGSRGGELALILGSRIPTLKVVIAKVPSHVVWPGCCAKEDFDQPSWTQNGKTLTAMAHPLIAYQAKELWPSMGTDWLGFYWLGLANTESETAAIIPVEKISGAILMITGGDDKCWPATYMANKVIERLKHFEFPHAYIHLCYDQSGHTAGALPYWPTARQVSPIHPVLNEPIMLGGTAEALAQSSLDSWNKTLEFLRKHL